MALDITRSISIAAASHNIAPQSWVVDSGASFFHVTSNKTQLTDCKQIVDVTTIHTVDGTSCHVTHEGTFSSHFYVPDISLAPQLSMNLLSVGQIANMNCFIGFDDLSCFIQDHSSGRVIRTSHRRRDSSNLYVLDTLHLPSTATSARVPSAVITNLIFCKMAPSS